MKVFFSLLIVSVFSLFCGCSTNHLGLPEKSNYIQKLSKEEKKVSLNINRVLSEKEEEALLLKKELLALQRQIKKIYGRQNINMKRIADGWKVTLLNKILFAPGSHTVNQSGMKILKKMASFLKNTEKTIEIIGHTDNMPILRTKNKYSSNWDLSVQRALSVIHIFQNEGVDPSGMRAVGKGKYSPLVANVSEKDRSKNRRVEILILDKAV